MFEVRAPGPLEGSVGNSILFRGSSMSSNKAASSSGDRSFSLLLLFCSTEGVDDPCDDPDTPLFLKEDSSSKLLG